MIKIQVSRVVVWTDLTPGEIDKMLDQDHRVKVSKSVVNKKYRSEKTLVCVSQDDCFSHDLGKYWVFRHIKS
jgi:hypothetical protein